MAENNGVGRGALDALGTVFGTMSLVLGALVLLTCGGCFTYGVGTGLSGAASSPVVIRENADGTITIRGGTRSQSNDDWFKTKGEEPPAPSTFISTEERKRLRDRLKGIPD